jgi:cell wall-associated NlpC family hydrolase
VLNASSWSLLVATVLGLGVALTPLGRLPGGEATASALLALVVVAMGSQGSFAGLASAPAFILAGATVLAIHAVAMVCVARLFRLDLALCGIASLANIGGIASAPVLAAAHRPALAPVGVLLALLGYLVGTGAGLGLAWALPLLGPGLAGPAMAVESAIDQQAFHDPRLEAAHWIARYPDADRPLLSAAEIAAANRRLLAADGSVRDLAALPDAVPQSDVAALITGLSKAPEGELVADGRPVTAADRGRWAAALAVDAIPATVVPKFALVTGRAALRRFPTAERVRRPDGAADIDLFQESAFFPGTPVAAVHASADGRWSFVLGTTYAAWIETQLLAFGPREAVLEYAARSTWIVVAARATAVPPPGRAASEPVALDMGAALPAAADRPAGVVELPVPGNGGALAFVAMRDGPLPASRRRLLEQAFRFLGERYGWGHDHDARDCSGLVCEVYRSLGILLPRNTRDQAVSPAFDRTVVGADWPRDRRLAALAALLPGDLVYAPRHVMMIVGHDDAGPWVIHDTHEGRLAGTAPEQVARGVVVASLSRILADGGGPIVDVITTLVRVLPDPAGDTP